MSANEKWLWLGLLLSWFALGMQSFRWRLSDKLICVQRERIAQLELTLQLRRTLAALPFGAGTKEARRARN